MLPLERQGGPLRVMLVVGVRQVGRLDNAAELAFQRGQPPHRGCPIGRKPVASRHAASWHVTGWPIAPGHCYGDSGDGQEPAPACVSAFGSDACAALKRHRASSAPPPYTTAAEYPAPSRMKSVTNAASG